MNADNYKQPPTFTARRLSSVRNLPGLYPNASITSSSIRWLIFNAEENGFNQCVLKMGRKILIDCEKFESWLEQEKS